MKVRIIGSRAEGAAVLVALRGAGYTTRAEQTSTGRRAGGVLTYADATAPAEHPGAALYRRIRELANGRRVPPGESFTAETCRKLADSWTQEADLWQQALAAAIDSSSGEITAQALACSACRERALTRAEEWTTCIDDGETRS